MRFIYTFLFMFCLSSAFSQTTIMYDGNGNVIGGTHIKTRPPEKVILHDSISNNTFVLDSTHVYITAYNRSGKVLWKTDPWKDNNIEVYRTRRPIIVNMKFGNNPGYSDKSKRGEKVIFIAYINTQFGFIELKTGKFFFEGQD